MENIKVVAFDCDGVMFDTTKANMSYYNEILQHFGRPTLTSDQFAYCHSHTADQSIAHLFNDAKSFGEAQNYRKSMSYIPFLKYMFFENLNKIFFFAQRHLIDLNDLQKFITLWATAMGIE